MSAVLAEPKFTSRPISPLKELGAYEALWKREGATFKSIADLFRAHANSIPSDFVPESEALDYAKIVLGLFEKAGIENFGVRVHGAGEYPDRLRDAWHPIEMLYYQGWWDLVNYPRLVAVVGTRTPSEDGIRRARKLVSMLVKDKFGIVSGLAKGVDTIAHTTAIDAEGFTVAVIGTPLNVAYPAENAELQQNIAKNHLVISQIPAYRYSQQTFRGNRLFFPERNITMSALTEATIIVEAGETSGTLTQARAALAQGRKLFILDSCFQNKALTWPKKFQDKGAIRVQEYEDIKKHLGATTGNR
jgi:DNA processing protein